MPKSMTFKPVPEPSDPCSRTPASRPAGQERAAGPGIDGHGFRHWLNAARGAGPAPQGSAQDADSRRGPRRRHRPTDKHARPAVQVQVVDSRWSLFLGLSAAAGFLLRRPAGCRPPAHGRRAQAPNAATRAARRAPAASGPRAVCDRAGYTASARSPVSHNATLLAVFKEEMFAIESEKLSGTIAPSEYKEQKAALETVLKRALKKQGS